MKLILTSEGFSENSDKILQELLGFCNKKLEDIKITLFTILQNDIHKYYLNKNIDLLKTIGFDLENIKTVNICKTDEAVNDLDVMYMCGGNTFEVLYYLQKNGFIQKIKDFINNGGIYFGHSAGSQILGPDIGIATAGVHGDINEIGLKDTSGLRLVDYAIWPHYVDEDSNQVKEYQQKYGYKFILLRDNESIIIDGNLTKFIY